MEKEHKKLKELHNDLKTGFKTEVNDLKTGFKTEVDDKIQELMGELTKLKADYKKKRAKEYPSMSDQLDDIYHNGIDAWKSTIKTIKDKYPK